MPAYIFVTGIAGDETEPVELDFADDPDAIGFAKAFLNAELRLRKDARRACVGVGVRHGPGMVWIGMWDWSAGGQWVWKPEPGDAEPDGAAERLQ